MGIPVDVNGTWKDGKPYVNDNGAWVEVQYAYANVNGSWKQVFANITQATGGSVSTINNYLGTGDTYKVHTFNKVGTFDFTVISNPNPFEVLVVGGGGNGGNGGKPGQGGAHVEKHSFQIAVGNHKVTVGNSGQRSSLGSLLSANGGASLTGGAGGGFHSSVSGTRHGYSGNGGKIWWNYCCPAKQDPPGPGGGSALGGSGAASYYGGGGAGMQHTASCCPQHGFRGIVIIAYKATT